MNIQIYFPKDLIHRLKKFPRTSFFLIGYHLEHVYVIVDLHEKEVDLNHIPTSLKGLQILGSVNNKTNHDLQLTYAGDNKLPFIDDASHNYCIVIFQPPKYMNLEYFSIAPIYLQSMGNEVVPNEHQLCQKLQNTQVPSNDILSISDELVLDKLNQTFRIRADLKKITRGSTLPKLEYFSALFHPLKQFAFTLVVFVIKSIQYVLISIICLLNYKLHGVSLVDISQTMRQLDLRLKQFNYFPIQFLCYYDKSKLYNQELVVLKNLKLPVFNSNLNINNSNYINFYNSIWLIFNDVLIGTTIYKFIVVNHKRILAFVHKVVIQSMLFDDMYRLIRWVSVNHPAGFKLNNELGQFMGDLYLWSLKFWKYFINDFLEEEVLKEIKQNLIKIVLQYVKFICYFGGLSFLVASVIDVIKIFQLHISGFYQTASKIYNKQIEVLKSLFQLFRGKKYNVLRNRIDNLNNYSAGDSFEIVQFLMGTLIFMLLVLLLPTVFAFYLTFFLLHLIGISVMVCLEWLQIVTTCAPLFMILLKVKNSNRLQGGVRFELLQSFRTTAYVQLSNKSLGYNEIFKNFIKLFRNCINFRASLIHFFFIGELISIDYDTQLKFNYLMLPDKYEETVNIWEIFSTKLDTHKT